MRRVWKALKAVATAEDGAVTMEYMLIAAVLTTMTIVCTGILVGAVAELHVYLQNGVCSPIL